MLKIINRFIFGAMLILAISAISSNVIKAEETTVETTNAVTATKKVDKPNAPRFIKGIDKGKSIKLSWTKVKKVNGYVIYRNGKKIKTIKKGKTLKYTDKKVKYNKIYKYYIKSFKKKSGKIIKSKKTFLINVKVCKKKYKKQNINYMAFWDINHNPMTYGEVEDIDVIILSKYDKKKISKKIRWYSSDKSLATVDSKGVVTINNNRKNGTVKIYAVAHNGYRKYMKIKIVDMMNPTSFDKSVFLTDYAKPLIKGLLPYVKSIASYFMYDRPGTEAKFEASDDAFNPLKITPEIEIDQGIKEKINFMVNHESYDLDVKNNYMEFKTKEYFKDGYIEYRLAICFDAKSDYNFKYDYDYVECAPRWYYAEIDH